MNSFLPAAARRGTFPLCRPAPYPASTLVFLGLSGPASFGPAQRHRDADGRRAAYTENDKLFIRERVTWTFTRRVHLSDDLDSAAVEASFNDGVLSVRIPVPEAGQRRYSRRDIVRVQQVVIMMGEGMTLAAIRRIIELEQHLAEVTRERDELARQLAAYRQLDSD